MTFSHRVLIRVWQRVVFSEGAVSCHGKLLLCTAYPLLHSLCGKTSRAWVWDDQIRPKNPDSFRDPRRVASCQSSTSLRWRENNLTLSSKHSHFCWDRLLWQSRARVAALSESSDHCRPERIRRQLRRDSGQNGESLQPNQGHKSFRTSFKIYVLLGDNCAIEPTREKRLTQRAFVF